MKVVGEIWPKDKGKLNTVVNSVEKGQEGRWLMSCTGHSFSRKETRFALFLSRQMTMYFPSGSNLQHSSKPPFVLNHSPIKSASTDYRNHQRHLVYLTPIFWARGKQQFCDPDQRSSSGGYP